MTRPPAAGFILAGGASRRMGTDKALLGWHGIPLLERTARTLLSITGQCVIIAPAGRYEAYGYPVWPDLWPGEGPLGGIVTALQQSDAELNLILAVDMPALDPAVLRDLVDLAHRTGRTVAPENPSGRVEPLCAVYQRGSLAALRAYFDGGGRAVKDALARIPTAPFRIDSQMLASVNTPRQFEAERK